MTIDVRTNAYPGGMIVSELIHDAGTIQERVIRSTLNTQEQKIRDALIKLGWTPPPPK